MEERTSLSINNIKISLLLFKYEELLHNIRSLHSSTDSQTSSFFILREEGFVYTIFRTGHINITKLKTVEDIVPAVQHIVKRLGYSGQVDYEIDNISASSCIGRIPNFVHFLHTICTSSQITSVRYVNSVFTSAFIKFQTGTVCLSKTGNLSLIGFKNAEDIDHCNSILLDLKQQYVFLSA